MALLKQEPAGSIVARVAAQLDEITAARDRGVTWVRITELIGADVGIPPTALGAPQRMRSAYTAAAKAVGAKRLARPRRPPPLAHPATDASVGQRRLYEHDPDPREKPQDLPGADFFNKLREKAGKR